MWSCNRFSYDNEKYHLHDIFGSNTACKGDIWASQSSHSQRPYNSDQSSWYIHFYISSGCCFWFSWQSKSLFVLVMDIVWWIDWTLSGLEALVFALSECLLCSCCWPLYHHCCFWSSCLDVQSCFFLFPSSFCCFWWG